MGIVDAKDMLTEGLRALEVLARSAPVGLPEFARLARLETRLAAAMMAVFERGGYAVRTPHGGLYLLTPMAIDLVFAHNPVGAIVTRAIAPVEACGLAIGLPVTLSIRRGARMRRVLASEAHPDFAVGTRFRMLDTVEGQVFAAFSASRRFGRADAIREAGYAMGTGRSPGYVLAVPLLVGQRSAAVLAVHFSGNGMSNAVRTFLPELQRVARALVGSPLNMSLVLPGPSSTLSASLH